MKKLLWLASWYPSRVDPFLGDFVERHARAAALGNQVTVIQVIRDPALKSRRPEYVYSGAGALKVFTGYYPRLFAEGSMLEKASSLWFRFRVRSRLVRRYRRENGAPDLVHVQIVWNAGITALWLRLTRGWRYILSEHWSLLSLPGALERTGWIRRFLIRSILSRADLVLVASLHLGERMERICPGMPYRYLPNVTDTTLFHLKESAREGSSKRFIHVSTLVEIKNPLGLLRAFLSVQEKLPEWQLWVVGPASPALVELAGTQKGSRISFTGMIPYEQVAALERDCDCLVMFSWSEGQPCAVAEALCCGIPVISTDVGGIPEMVGERVGILVPAGDEEELGKAMVRMAASLASYDKAGISARAVEQFSYEAVALRLDEIYREYARKT